MKISIRVLAAALALLMVLAFAACGEDKPAAKPDAPVISGTDEGEAPENPVIVPSDNDEDELPDGFASITSDSDADDAPAVSDTDADTSVTSETDMDDAGFETDIDDSAVSQTDVDAPMDDDLGEIGDAATDAGQEYITVSREGVEEKIPVDSFRGSFGFCDYSIAMDSEYFQFTTYEGIDSFTYDEWEGDRSVYYCVYAHTDISADELANGIVHQYGEKYADCFTEAVKVGEYDALAVYLGEEAQAPSYNMHFFIIERGSDCVVIETQFAFEMYEGLYAIMRQCFNTIRFYEAG